MGRPRKQRFEGPGVAHSTVAPVPSEHIEGSGEKELMSRPKLYTKQTKTIAAVDVITVTSGGDRVTVKQGTEIGPDRKCKVRLGETEAVCEINLADFQDALKQRAFVSAEIEIPYEG